MVRFVVDASVLIDYLETDPEILELANARFGLLITGPVFDEVDQLCDPHALGMELVVLEHDQATACLEIQRSRPALSFADASCIILARSRSLEVLTSDRALRNSCEALGVPTRRSLALLQLLVESRDIDDLRALESAKRVIESNPRMPRDLLREFRRQLYDRR